MTNPSVSRSRSPSIFSWVACHPSYINPHFHHDHKPKLEHSWEVTGVEAAKQRHAAAFALAKAYNVQGVAFIYQPIQEAQLDWKGVSTLIVTLAALMNLSLSILA